MFFGEFEYHLDDKGRLPFPPRFRQFFRDGIVLAQGMEKCITIYTVAEWKNWPITLPPANFRQQAENTGPALFATAYHLTLDSQGRISLPPSLRQYAGIGDAVIIAGVNNYLELWDKTQWEKVKQESQEQAWQITESLERP